MMCCGGCLMIWLAPICIASALSMAQGETSRGEFIQQSLAAAAALTLLPGNANAGWLAGSPEVIDPKDAEVDRDILASEEVQKALSSVKNYKALIEGFSSTLASDSQADIGPTIRKELDFVKIRADLNTLNTAFDEDTQRGTDRLIRAILQDITELETANKQKPGVARSEIRLNAMKGKIAKLGKAFDEYLAFAN